MRDDILLSVEDLEVHFKTEGGIVKAVDGVSFQLRRGETLGIVGESGSGKSVTCNSIMRLIPSPPGRIAGGRILFEGRDLRTVKQKEMLRLRGNEISMIFQDPMTSLNPFLKVSRQLTEVLELHQGMRGSEARREMVTLVASGGMTMLGSRA